MGQPSNTSGGGGKSQQPPQPQQMSGQVWRPDRYQQTTQPAKPGGYQNDMMWTPNTPGGAPPSTGGKAQQPPRMAGPEAKPGGKAQQAPQPGGPLQQAQPAGKGQQSPPPQGGMMMPGASGKGQQPPGMGYNNGMTMFTPQGGMQQQGMAQPLGYANMQGGPWGGWNSNPNPWGVPNWMGGSQQYAPPPSNPMQSTPSVTGGVQTGGVSPNPNAPPQPGTQQPPAAAGPTPPQDFGQTFEQLFRENPTLAYHATNSAPGAAGQWMQRNQNLVRDRYFGGDQNAMNQWINDSSQNTGGDARQQAVQRLMAMGYR